MRRTPALYHPRLPFASDQRSLLLAVRALVGLLHERIATSESPYVCTEDGTLGGLHLDAIVAGLQSHGITVDATSKAIGRVDTEEDIVRSIVDSLRMLLDVAAARSDTRTEWCGS